MLTKTEVNRKLFGNNRYGLTLRQIKRRIVDLNWPADSVPRLLREGMIRKDLSGYFCRPEGVVDEMLEELPDDQKKGSAYLFATGGMRGAARWAYASKLFYGSGDN